MKCAKFSTNFPIMCILINKYVQSINKSHKNKINQSKRFIYIYIYVLNVHVCIKNLIRRIDKKLQYNIFSFIYVKEHVVLR